MRNRRKLFILITVVIAALALTATIVMAHNAGHIHLGNGTCVDVGSGKHHPIVDLIPGPGDQYGTRFAAEMGNTPIWPRHCDEPGAHNHP